MIILVFVREGRGEVALELNVQRGHRRASIWGSSNFTPTGACVCTEHMVARPGSCHRAQQWRDERWLHPRWTSCYSKAAAAAAATPVTAKEEGEITTCVRRGCPDSCSPFITRLH